MTTEKYLKTIVGSFPQDSYFVICTRQDSNWQQFPMRVLDLESGTKFVELQPPDIDCYLRLTPIKNNPGLGKRGTADDTLGSYFLWMDIDFHETKDYTTKVDQAIKDLSVSKYPPTFYVKSGRGLHCYWQLNYFEKDCVKLSKALHGLVSYYKEYGSDPAATDLVRVLRIPGTYNTKVNEKAELFTPENSKVYSDISIFPTPVEPLKSIVTNIEITPEPIPADFETYVKAKNPILWGRIVSSENVPHTSTSYKADGTIDRSKNDYFIANSLLRLNYSPGVVMSVLQHPTWFSGERFRDGKRHVAEYDIRAAMANPSISLNERFFDGKKFKSELVTKYIQENDPIISVGRELFLYKNNYYQPDTTGNMILKHIYDILHEGSCWSSANENEVYANLKSMNETLMDDLNKYPDLINVQNGILNLLTGELLPHSKDYLFTYQIPVSYNKDADSTPISDFMDSMLEPDVIPVIWEFVGFCFMRGYPIKSILFLIGEAHTGKTTLLEFIRNFLDKRNTEALSLESLASGNSFAHGWLFNKLANINSEVSAHVDLHSIESIKSLASPDQMISANVKYRKEPLRFRTQAKLMFGANDYPTISRADAALVERFLCVPCKHKFLQSHIHRSVVEKYNGTIPENIAKTVHSADINILEKLSSPETLSGALNLAMLGYRRLKAQGGFSKSETIDEENKRFKLTVDYVLAFVNEESKPAGDLKYGDDSTDVKPRKVYEAFRRWCSVAGIKTAHIPPKRAFMKKIIDENLVRKINKTDSEYWRGRIWNCQLDTGIDNFIRGIDKKESVKTESTESTKPVDTLKAVFKSDSGNTIQ